MSTKSKQSTAVSAEFLEKMRLILEADRKRLTNELAELRQKAGTGEGDAAFPNYGDSEEDNAREVADYEANMGIENDLEKSLRDVNSALARMDKGTYGICRYCGKMMSEKRLLARPTSSACVDCKKTIVQEA